MELIEVLVVLLLASNGIIIIFLLYLFAKIYIVETIVKGVKKSEIDLKRMLNSKIPIIVNDQGQPVMPNMEVPKKPNPLTG